MATVGEVEDTAIFGTEGLHARPAAEIVKISKRYASKVELCKGDKVGPARSSVKLLLLGVLPGDSVTIRARGPDAERVVHELREFISTQTSNGPPPDATGALPPGVASATVAPPVHAAEIPAPAAAVPDPTVAPDSRERRRLTGICGSKGAAVGPAFVLDEAPIRVPVEALDPAAIERESARLEEALHTLVRELQDEASTREAGAIVRALLEIATDAELRRGMQERVRSGMHPIRAALEGGEAIAAEFSSIQDATLRGRADDVRAIARRVAGILSGNARVDPGQLRSPSILIASHLDPWDLARFPPQNLLGIVTAEGGATSHLAIIARSLGIPALMGVHLESTHIASASEIALDAEHGVAILEPKPEEAAEIRQRIEAAHRERQELEVYRDVQPCTRGGRAITVACNLGSLAEIEPAQAAGAMGVGLFRTELLFMAPGGVPDESRQADVYGKVCAAFPGYRVVIRTLDIGGDKVVPGVVNASERNPFLGWRGIRMCLDRLDLFKPQLRALLRAAVHGNMDVMFPMISIREEVEKARALLAQCEQELKTEGVPIGCPRVGIMVETPAAALCARDLAKVSEFFSIGTNDLTQYVMAADRTNPRLAYLSGANQPAVLSLVEATCRAAQQAGIPVAVCGEAASNPEIIPALIKSGVDELSMNAPAIARAKRIVTLCE